MAPTGIHLLAFPHSQAGREVPSGTTLMTAPEGGLKEC
jgi:hypothetical protein